MSIRKAIRKEWRRRSLLLKGRLAALTGRGSKSEELRLYNMMRADSAAASSIYQPGRFWDELNRSHADMIRGGGLQNLRDEYINRTFAGPDPESRQVYRALLYLYLKHLRTQDETCFLERHEDTPIGGTVDQENIDGRHYSIDFLQSVDEAFKMRKAWSAAGKSGDPRMIVELGAGFGRLAHVCLNMFPLCTYVILDLPEALMCSTSWLSRVFPGLLVPYQEARQTERLNRELLETKRLWALTPDRIERVEDSAADVCCNIYSLAEMPKASIANYFRHLDRIADGAFYTKQRIREDNKRDGIVVSKDSYPIPSRWTIMFELTSTLYENVFEAAYSTRSSLSARMLS